MYDIIIIGAGVIGTSAARELSRYDLDIALLEANYDVATGSSGANSAIVHAGYDCTPGTLMARLNVKGNEMYEQTASELDVPFKRIGSMVIALTDEDMDTLNVLLKNGRRNGVKGLELLNKKQALNMQPNLNPDILGALWAPTAGITCPYEMTIAMAENAVQNGVHIFLNTAVKNICKQGEIFKIQTSNGEFESKYIVNCAGVKSDLISKMAGADEFNIIPRKGEYCLYDKKLGDKVSCVIFQPPSKLGKGVLVTPTVDGNLLIGPNAVDIDNREDSSTTPEGLEYVFHKALSSVPTLSRRDIIRTFSGIRAVSDTGDFIVGESQTLDGFFNAAGICSPGLSAAPAIGREIADIVSGKVNGLKLNKTFSPYRKAIPRFREMSWEEKDKLIKIKPSYGRIICRCETVTEGEIIDAIHRPRPALTVDAVKRRTRAGMGRCQGGFCTPRVMEIIERELGLEFDRITKKGENSNIAVGRIKEDLYTKAEK